MLFDLDAVTVGLGGRSVLGDLRFSVGEGQRVVLLGVNGSGKTTLLKLLDALILPSGGSILYDGLPLNSRAMESAAFRRRFRGEVALVFQNVDAMLFNPSVADEIAFGPRQFGLPGVEARVARWADTFGVGHLLERPPFELSGGEKKRVALASVFAIEPRVLLLDEATSGLDPASAARLLDLLAELSGLTVISSTHNLTVAGELGSRAILLAPGRQGVLFDGPTEDLLADEGLLIESGLAHSHGHAHGASRHTHFHTHDMD